MNTISTTNDARFGFWGNLPLSRKLLIAFGALFVLGLLIAASGLWGVGRVQNAYETMLAGGLQIQGLSDHLEIQLLEARRREEDFLLRWQVEGYETAYNNYVVLHQQHVIAMGAALDELGVLAPEAGRGNLPGYPQSQFEADIASLNENLTVYDEAFSTTIGLIEERGFTDTGLEGEFRLAVQAIEARIYDREGLDPLVITTLQIRRREKDYLLRGDQEYVVNVADLIAQLKSQTTESEVLTPAEKSEITALADSYLEKFNALVEIDRQIAESTEILRASATDLQNTAARLEAAGEQLAQLDIETAEANSVQTFVLTSTVVLLVLGASIVLALGMSRQITQPVLKLQDTAREIAAGNFDAQAEVSSGDEIGTLAQTLNLMTKRLGEAFVDVRRRAFELATVAEVSTATSTILEVNRLLQEVVDLTKERFNLYHSHIYLLDEAGENLVLTAGAGEPGRIMAAEKRSIPVRREQSLVARAARERKGVTVNDVTLEPDFLPNPLLPDTHSELAVPMLVGNTLVGVFDIQSEQVGRFTESDINIQTTLAAQLASSVQNVRSYERSKAQADFESTLKIISQKIQRAGTMEDTLQTAIRELGTAIGASRVKASISAQKSGNDN